ncbi:MAG: GxxExxY protein [Lentisphaerae bacterium]|nr:GxxExxY protein [Lentisphaerota bacterium]
MDSISCHRQIRIGGNHETHQTHEREGKEIIYREESYQIVGACFEVYKEKGNGFLEAVYQECLGKEFKLQGIDFREKPRLQIDYKGQVLEQYYEPDFLCLGKIIVEIKAVKNVSDEHRAQLINYLKATGLRLGLLVNFGHYPKIEHERFAN